VTYQPPQYPPPPTSGQPYSAPPPGFGYPPVQPPPAKRKKWPWIVGGIVLVAILGCVGLFTLVLGGTAKVASDLDDNQKGKNAVAGKMGSPSTDGKFQFTVTAMHCGVAQVGDGTLGKKPQGVYCLVNVTIKNVGNSAEVFDSFSQKATGPDGTEFSTDPVAENYVNDQDQTFLEDINPGNQVKGTLAFDVPKGTKLSSIVLHESLFTTGVKVPLR
jgi:hypothetical protein